MDGSIDYYKVLGVSIGASNQDVEAAFKVLVHQHHPDKNDGRDNGMMKRLNEARVVLTKERTKYERLRAEWLAKRWAAPTPPPSPPPPRRPAANAGFKPQQPPPRHPPSSPRQKSLDKTLRVLGAVFITAILGVASYVLPPLADKLRSTVEPIDTSTVPPAPEQREPPVPAKILRPQQPRRIQRPTRPAAASARPTTATTPTPTTRCVPAQRAPLSCYRADPHEAVARHAVWNCANVRQIIRYDDGTYNVCACRWCQDIRP